MLKFVANSTTIHHNELRRVLALTPKRSQQMVNARPATSAAGDEQQSPKSSSGAGAFFKATALVGGAAVVGGLVWAYYDPDVRKKLEAAVPQSKPVLDTIYGAIGQQQQQPKTQTFAEKPRPKPVPPQLPVDESAKLKLTTIAELSPQPSAIPTTQKEAKLIEIMPVDVHTEGPKIEIKPMKKEPTGVLDKEYESQLTTALGEAGKKADTAKEAKFRTIQALKRHSEALKAAVDSGVRKDDDAGGTLWEKVKTAQREADGCAEQDRAEEGAARGAIDKLEKLISEGKQQRGKDAPSLVSNAQQMAAKLRDRLDELNLMLGREQAQSRIFTNYRQLVEEGRRQWADELRSVFPDIDLRAKQGSLTQEELDAFIVHANLRIDQLKRQLAEHQAQEEQRVADAVDEQRQLDEGLARVALEFERRRVRNDTGLDLDARVAQERQLWEAELEAQLKRAALAHAEHLERVIKTQKQIHDVENTQLVKEAVKIEQYKHAKQIEAAVTKLNAIEEALNSRAAQDLTNRRAKIYWTICQTLLDTLVNGDAAMKNGELAYSTKPLKEVSFIKELIDQDTFAQSLCHCFPERALEQGVPTELGLKRRYNKVHKLARRTAQIDENGGGPLKYLASWLQSLVMLRMPVVSSADEHINLNIYEPYDLLGRVQQFVDQGDLINAIRVANLLRGEPARIFRDWLADARFHLEVRYLVELLFANAQASGIRTTY